MHLAIVIPVYNEGDVIYRVINTLPKKIDRIAKISIIAVDDGSTDNSAEEIRKTKAALVSHSYNLGAGSATVTGFEAAKILRADLVVTLDGDGQHNPKDIPGVIKPIIENKADLVIGTRLKNHKGMPWHKKIGNIGLNVVTFLLSGKWASDSQSGFKAFSHKAINNLKLDSLGYEFCSEIIMEASTKNLRIKEVPIQVIYNSYSKNKGQPILNGVNIVAKLIFRKITG